LGLPAARAQSWNVLTSGLDTNLRGISAAKISSASHIAIWASGSHGVILRSLDDGATWTRLALPGEPDLDLRGVVAISDPTSYRTPQRRCFCRKQFQSASNLRKRALCCYWSFRCSSASHFRWRQFLVCRCCPHRRG